MKKNENICKKTKKIGIQKRTKDKNVKNGKDVKGCKIK